MLNQVTEKILKGEKITKTEALTIIKCNVTDLCLSADKIKQKFCGNKIDLCSIISGRGGNCSENCKFCAQSKYHSTGAECYSFLDEDVIVEDCKKHRDAGIHRYSIVTAGRALGGTDFKKAVSAYSKMHRQCNNISLCASHGLLSYEQFKELKNSGVNRYHCNIETSESYFKNICTTHSFKDKIDTINSAKRAGLEICSGGIIGMGETMEDRIDMAFTLAELNVNSIPINVLNPIKNTPLENEKPLSEEEILKTIAIFRFINPKADIRMAAGRNKLKNNGIDAFKSGANSTITGDFLTTTGSTIKMDKDMFVNNGFDISTIKEDN